MGAFLILPSEYSLTEDTLKIFREKGFTGPSEFLLGNIKLLLYDKQLITVKNHYRQGDSSVYSTGTCFYKNRSHEDSLKEILKDFIDNTLVFPSLKGSFFLVIRHDNINYFYSDPASVQNIFFNGETGVISSSFLACTAALSGITKGVRINKDALAEILVTGSLIGPDTMIEGIHRYEASIHSDLPGLSRISPGTVRDIPEHGKNFSDEVDKQNKVLSEYFSGIKCSIEEYGVMTGLTGGFDSRLLLLHLNDASGNYEIYSTSRERPTREFICAREFSKAMGRNLRSLNHEPPEKMKSEKLEKTLRGNFYFNDGLIRTNQLWLEEIKSRDYLARLYEDKKIGFSGVGGEQYRNSEYLIAGSYDMDNWIFNELVYKNCGDPFDSSQSRKDFIENLSSKILKILKIENSGGRISHYNIKRYYNEIYNPANRTIRNNIENQLVFFLSPFTDYSVSQSAYDAVKFLGLCHEFEKEMIRRSAPELSGAGTDYGYSISGKIPFKYYAVSVLKRITGLRAYNRIYYGKKKAKQKYLKNLLSVHPELKKYIDAVKKLNLPLNLQSIEQSDLLSPLLIEAGFFITEMNDFLVHD